MNRNFKNNNRFLQNQNEPIELKDYGANPFFMNIKKAAIKNNTYRTALWTGRYMQLTLMSISPGDDVGLEVHPDTDQFFLVEYGKGYVFMGPEKDNLNYQSPVIENYSIIIPAGTWHNIVNTGNMPLKLVSIYAPPAHPFGTVHQTKKQADEEEHKY